MAYNEALAQNIREILEGEAFIEARKMFGGLSFLHHGNMFCAASSRNCLLLRVGPEQYETVLKQPHVREVDMGGKPRKGFVYIDSEGYATQARLQCWVTMGLDYVRTLPAKE